MAKIKKQSSVLMVIERFSPIIGGAETQCFQLSSGFFKKGIKVTVVTKRWFESLNKEETFKPGFKVFRIGKPGFSRLNDYCSGFSLTIFLVKNFRAFDIFYINGGLANIFGSTAILLGKILGKKIIAKVETPGELFFSGPKALSPKKFVHPLIKLRLDIAKKTDFFIAQTLEIKEQLLELKIKEKRIRFITNSVDTDFFDPPKSENEKIALRKKWFLPEKKIVVIFCGRLAKRKGLVYLLDAWYKERFEKAVLILVGSGENQSDSVESQLKKTIEERKIKTVYFLGSKKREEVEELLKASDIFVYPSIHPEGTALSVLEAMAVGLPIIVSDIGGLEDVVENDKDGFLFPPKNIKALGSVLTKLIDKAELRNDFGENGRNKVLCNYSTEKIVDDYLKFFDSL